MAPLAQTAASPGSGSPGNALNEISDINRGLERIKQNLNQLRMLQDRSLNETDSSSGTSRQVDDLSAATMSDYRGLVQRVRELKSNRDAQTYRGQVDRVDRALKETIQQYQQVEADFRRKMQGQMERQYRIVRPDADANEVRAAVEDMSAGGQQVFQQAMMQSNRQGQARAVLNEVQNRHQELLKIEQQMTELAQLIQDLDTLIIQQEPMVQQIDEHVEKTQEDLKEANVELDTAVETVRKTRKKKWICCGIVGKHLPWSRPLYSRDLLLTAAYSYSPHHCDHCRSRRHLVLCCWPRQEQQHHHHQHKAQLGLDPGASREVCCGYGPQDDRRSLYDPGQGLRREFVTEGDDRDPACGHGLRWSQLVAIKSRLGRDGCFSAWVRYPARFPKHYSLEPKTGLSWCSGALRRRFSGDELTYHLCACERGVGGTCGCQEWLKHCGRVRRAYVLRGVWLDVVSS